MVARWHITPAMSIVHPSAMLYTVQTGYHLMSSLSIAFSLTAHNILLLVDLIARTPDVDVAYCSRRRDCVVCVCVLGTTVSCAKMAEPVWGVDSCGPRLDSVLLF